MRNEVVRRFLSMLHGVKPSGDGWTALCPAHDDRSPSLSISEGRDGRTLVHCHAGCAQDAVVSAVGMTLKDLMPAIKIAKPAGTKRRRVPSFATARDAVAVLENQYGPPSNIWTYTDTGGKPVGVVIRWDHQSGKQIRPVSKRGDDWTIGGMTPPRPLYRVTELESKARVYVCEGEKAADAAVSVGLVATTSAHGSGGAHQTDWSPLAGRDIVVFPDNDAAGRKYAHEVVACLAALVPPPSVRVVDLPDLAAGGDMADFVATRGGADQKTAIVEEIDSLARNVTVDTPTRVVAADDVSRFHPFPVDTLPAPLAEFVRLASTSLVCDESYIALPLLVGLASAIGNTRSIQLKESWREPAIMWGALIGESGSTKSPALELSLRPVRERQSEKMAEYQNALQAWERDNKDAKRPKADKETDASSNRPVCERCWTDDVTTEGLIKLLKENPRGLLSIRDELAAWLHFDRYAQRGSGGESAQWLQVFGGRSIFVDRKTSPVLYAPRAAVSLIGCIQPDTLRRALGREHREDGLAARLLLTMPPRRPKVWTDDQVTAEDETPVARIFERLYALQGRPRNNGTEICPIPIQLDPVAHDAWVAFYNQHGQEHAELWGDLAAAWAKLEGYAARLALVVHLVRCVAGDPTIATPDRVDAASIESGVTLCRWFAREARRAYVMLNETEQESERRKFIERIRRCGGSVSTRQWQRSRSHPTAQIAESELHELVAAGFGQWVTAEPGPKGGRSSRRFVLHGSDTTSDTSRPNPPQQPENEVVSVVSVSVAGEGSEIPASGEATTYPVSSDPNTDGTSGRSSCGQYQ